MLCLKSTTKIEKENIWRVEFSSNTWIYVGFICTCIKNQNNKFVTMISILVRFYIQIKHMLKYKLWIELICGNLTPIWRKYILTMMKLRNISSIKSQVINHNWKSSLWIFRILITYLTFINFNDYNEQMHGFNEYLHVLSNEKHVHH